MNLRIVREIFNPTNTISKLYINDEYFCDILEDVDRGLYFTQPLDEIKAIKVYGKTAIPKGVYEIIISYSNRFQQYLPLLLNVPGYEGIRIHPGNYAGEETFLKKVSPNKNVLTTKEVRLSVI